MQYNLCWFLNRFLESKNEYRGYTNRAAPPLLRAMFGKMPAHSTASCRQMSPSHPKVGDPLDPLKVKIEHLQRGISWDCLNATKNLKIGIHPALVQGTVSSWKFPRFRFAKESVLFSWHLIPIATSQNDGWRLWMGQRRGVDTLPNRAC